jgi:hypothetical protein
MNSPQTIDKQKGNQALSHHNTVFSQLLKLIPRHKFETLENSTIQDILSELPQGGRSS